MDNRSAPAISLGEWIITLIVLAIPLVNIIMLFVWGFSSGTNPSKGNFCKADADFLPDRRRVLLPVRWPCVLQRDARHASADVARKAVRNAEQGGLWLTLFFLICASRGNRCMR